MAKHNFVLLNGQVTSNPRIYRDNEGNPLRGMCAVTVIRGTRDFGDNLCHIKYDCPIIITGNPVQIEEMAAWKENDMVEIKGAITTKDINKSTKCDKCGEKTTEKGTAVFVNPIYMARRETNITKEQGFELLKKRAEISNIATVVGKLMKDPEVYSAPNGMQITQYSLGVMRKYRIKEDAAEIRVDYPWVKSYSKIAELDAKVLRKDSKVFVDGMLQARDVLRKTVCPNCGHEYTWNDTALEIVPYAVEYLEGCLSIEELEEQEEAKAESVVNGIFQST